MLAKLAPKFHLLVLWLLHVNMSFIYGAYVPVVMDVIVFNDLFKHLCAHVYVTQVRTHLMAKFKFQNQQQQLQPAAGTPPVESSWEQQKMVQPNISVLAYLGGSQVQHASTRRSRPKKVMHATQISFFSFGLLPVAAGALWGATAGIARYCDRIDRTRTMLMRDWSRRGRSARPPFLPA